MFVSDHGDNLGSHGRFNKNALIEESIRIPLIVHDPRNSYTVTDREHVANTIDVMPTLLDLVGIPVPEHVQGQSLAPIVRGESAAQRRNMAFIETGPMIGVRTVSHLYGMKYDEETHRPIQDDIWFYDLVDDPLEQNNLAGTGRQSETERTLRNALLEWDQNTRWLKAPKHVPKF